MQAFRPTRLITIPRAINQINKARAMSSVPTFGFPERQPSAEEKALVNEVLNLYQLNPITSAYAKYSNTARFSDPVSIADGLESIKAQFNGMPSIFSKSITKDVKYLDNPAVKPPSVQVAAAQEYTFKGINTSKLVNSLITFHVDPESNLIQHHEEQWDGKDNTKADDGFFGKINEMRKKATAGIINSTVDSTPKDQK